ncbi:ABC transporter permease subunit [Culicoidibacter larvae]|uniref:ABC transporter n=1 Tax=Culicoidibacter larvae TaxID=2579976 RepID=A0A5R8QC65_9FIRM|nr:ABC transporter permease subunit [Culicoidibacter larvae]TLG72918.1 ABC transporter [Culicoidibacter larvae]
MNIIWQELKANKKALFFWCVGIFFMAVVGMTKYSASSQDAQALTDIVKQMPASIQALFGLSQLDMSQLADYFGILFPFNAIIAVLHAGLLGANTIAKEERDKTSEFLYVKPISRNRVLSDKLIAILLQLLVLNIVTIIGSFIGVAIFGGGQMITAEIFMFMAAMFGMQLFFAAIGFCLAASLKNTKLATGISAIIVVVTYLLSAIISMAGDNLAFLDILTPFKYYDPYTMLHGDFNWMFVVVNALVVIVAIGAGYFFYNRRDFEY